MEKKTRAAAMRAYQSEMPSVAGNDDIDDESEEQKSPSLQFDENESIDNQ